MDIQERHEFFGGFAISCLGWVIVTWRRRIIRGVHSGSVSVLDDAIDEAMMIVRACEHVVKIENGYVVEGVAVILQPIIHQPEVEGACVFRKRRVGNRWCGDNEFSLPGGSHGLPGIFFVGQPVCLTGWDG